MSLRTRLWLVLATLFLVPLLVGALVIAEVLPGARAERADDSARDTATAVSAQLADKCRWLGLAAYSPAFAPDAAAQAEAVAVLVDGGYVDYAAVLGADGDVMAEAGQVPGGVARSAELPSCTRDRAPSTAPLLAERVPLSGTAGPTGAVTALRVDSRFVEELRDRTGSTGEVVLLSGEAVVASTSGTRQTATLAESAPRGSATTSADGWTLATRAPQQGVPYTVLVAVPDPMAGTGAWAVALLLAGALLAAGLLLLVARALSRPFTELTVAAERVAEGDLDAPVSTSEEGEAGRIGNAFNRMTGELRRSRQDLRSSLDRIGDALSSTHDLDRLLNVVLDTARVTLTAKAGVVMYRSAEQLRLVAAEGLEESGLPEPKVVVPGSGILGGVVATGAAARGSIGSSPGLEPAGPEPARGDVLAVPLRSMGSVVGVVALYDREDGRAFDAEDEEALGTLVGQASIAVDNVQLHHEAQRLSTTDPLTGLWNFRYLSMSLAREIERSTRFDRPLAVLMLDLDHFKLVNDRYGHQRGDTVLREIAYRVQEQIREVDTFARYGGEEFVVVLPETTVEGAAQLAERICVAVRREPFVHEDEEPLNITVSIGGAAFPQHGSSPATLMRAADKALYVAKAEGRDRWHVPAI